MLLLTYSKCSIYIYIALQKENNYRQLTAELNCLFDQDIVAETRDSYLGGLYVPKIICLGESEHDNHALQDGRSITVGEYASDGMSIYYY